MDFNAYLKEQKIDADKAATALGKTKAYVHMLIAKTCTPSLHLAAVIEFWSGGAVPMQTWPDWKALRRQVKPRVRVKRPVGRPKTPQPPSQEE